ncbi:MAG: CopG family transcriptional regulator [Halobacteriaceae archaeon]
MGSKNKTVSFRVNEDTFESLRDIAEERDISLSAVFRDYVDTLVANDGQVSVVPDDDSGESTAFPPTVEVPKSFVREHERLELEAKHLREQLEEHKQYVAHLREQLEEREDVIHLEDLDGEASATFDWERASYDPDEPFRLG